MSDQTPPDQDAAVAKAAASQRRVSLRSLFLDPNNYRIIHEPDQKQVLDSEVKNRDVMQRTMRLLCGDKNQNIQDLMESFKANGYLRVDQILVRELPDSGFLVVEGNRRVATLKFLQQEYESKGIDLGQLDPEIFSRCDGIVYSRVDNGEPIAAVTDIRRAAVFEIGRIMRNNGISAFAEAVARSSSNCLQ
ncbi:DUF6710 family protein [Magnetospirillum gryphiswaldense]|uniref:Uncharacterized protein n=1 Tax=Magnetospirillum gryphiswaldense TaxID=55518 RepID=A4TZL8_9PROT|nr:DUF6710 family protein [Magnetospirillum gryphiswaldense]AVM73624.1 hypothetical protein MSR1_11260 [Magnetospirillum gryphiswaldense MSR-1]AVM77527.1 hypothetical protein MSR1L_11260 [Magnetospirillum gryphiswaldense]CAM76075.1 hypothetical protein MGR_2230 [Magnetospirillum gryphiswaldense MSR-1]